MGQLEPVRVELRPLGEREPVTTGEGTLVRRSLVARLAWAVAFVLGGLVGGAFFVFVPILHLCLPWALPLAGLFAAVRTFVTDVLLREIRGACPLCRVTVPLEGGGGGGPHFGNCVACKKPLEARLVEPGAG